MIQAQIGIGVLVGVLIWLNFGVVGIVTWLIAGLMLALIIGPILNENQKLYRPVSCLKKKIE